MLLEDPDSLIVMPEQDFGLPRGPSDITPTGCLAFLGLIPLTLGLAFLSGWVLEVYVDIVPRKARPIAQLLVALLVGPIWILLAVIGNAIGIPLRTRLIEKETILSEQLVSDRLGNEFVLQERRIDKFDQKLAGDIENIVSGVRYLRTKCGLPVTFVSAGEFEVLHRTRGSVPVRAK